MAIVAKVQVHYMLAPVASLPTKHPNSANTVPRREWQNTIHRLCMCIAVTLTQWLSYYLHQRPHSSNILHLSERLFQEFVCDGFATVEQQRLRWISINQPKLRASLYRGVAVNSFLGGSILFLMGPLPHPCWPCLMTTPLFLPPTGCRAARRYRCCQRGTCNHPPFFSSWQPTQHASTLPRCHGHSAQKGQAGPLYHHDFGAALARPNCSWPPRPA